MVSNFDVLQLLGKLNVRDLCCSAWGESRFLISAEAQLGLSGDEEEHTSQFTRFPSGLVVQFPLSRCDFAFNCVLMWGELVGILMCGSSSPDYHLEMEVAIELVRDTEAKYSAQKDVERAKCSIVPFPSSAL